MEYLNKHSMIYKPKNNWHFNNHVNECFTPEQFEKLEEYYDFSDEDIYINHLYCNAFGDFKYDFEFKGVKFSGFRKLDSVTKALWSEETIEYIEFEMTLELLSHDGMNDVYLNHELYI